MVSDLLPVGCKFVHTPTAAAAAATTPRCWLQVLTLATEATKQRQLREAGTAMQKQLEVR